MRIPRIYLDLPLHPNTEVPLDERSAHYLGKVLRMKAGMALTLFNGRGAECSGELVSLEKRRGIIRLKDATTPASESRLHTILGIGISRGERMDYVVQKSTEMGVNVIQPLFTEFCEVKLDEKRGEKRRQHWQQVGISAAEQSGRVLIPEVLPPVSAGSWIKSLACERKYLLDQEQSGELAREPVPEQIALFIGPEGGMSDNEKALADSKGFIGLNLGPRTLRTETAPVAALSLFQYLWGN